MSGGDQDVPMEEERKAAEEEEEEEEEDDPIVAEYDVYVANRLVDNLHLFQFPMRPPGRNYNFDMLQSMRMQLGSKRFELIFNTKNQQHSIFDAVQQDEGVENMPYHLTSTRTRNKTNYAVGVVRGNMLHMTGLSNLHQFRPNVDANIKVCRPEQVEQEQKEEKLTAQQQAKLDQMQKQYEGRLRSVWLQQQEQDSWIEMGLSTANNPESKKGILERLFASNEQVQMNPKHTTNMYLNAMFKKTKDAYLKEANAKIPLAMASDYDWQKQVESLMQSAKIMRFSRLKSLLVPKNSDAPDLPTDAQLLDHLRTCTVSIRGLFIVKASPEYAQPVLAWAREWVLLNFWRNERVKRSDLTDPNVFQLPVSVEVVKNMMSDFAELDMHKEPEKRRWMLKYGNRDTDMLQTFPQEAKTSDGLWESERVKAITANVKDTDPEKKRLAFGWTAEKAAVPRQSVQGRQQEIVNWIVSNFAVRGVWNQAVCTAKFKEKTAAAGIPDDVFVKVLRSVTMPFNDSIILRRTSFREELEIDKFRPRYIKALTEKQTWTKKDLDAHIGEVPRHHAEKILAELSTRNGNLVIAKAGALN